MKKLLLLITAFSFSSIFALEGLNPKRKRIYHCRNFGATEEVEELFIVKSQLGKNSFYEVEVPYLVLNRQKTFFKKLNLISKYEGKVELFTTGNYRVKVDKALPKEKKYKSFVRLPKFDVHSTDWFCKDY